MDAIISQQGSLKLSQDQGLITRDNLQEGKEYSFQKEKHRLYLLDTPMDLITEDWQAIAKVVVTEITIGHGQTSGRYKILKVFTDEEMRVVSETIIPFDQVRGEE